MDRRVVITGLGAVTPCGNSPEELWNSLMAGKHGFELAPWFPDQEPDNLSVVARVKDFDPSEYFDKKELRRNDVIVQYAVYCAMQALKDAGTDLKDIDPYRVGVVIGSGIGGIYTTEEEMSNYHNKGNKRVGVFTITKMIGNMAAGEVAIRTGFKGSNFCVTTACASGTQRHRILLRFVQQHARCYTFHRCGQGVHSVRRGEKRIRARRRLRTAGTRGV